MKYVYIAQHSLDPTSGILCLFTSIFRLRAFLFYHFVHIRPPVGNADGLVAF